VAKGGVLGITSGLTTRINGPFDPPQVSNDIIGDKVVRLIITVPATAGGFNITPTTVAGQMPNGTAGDLRFRIKNVSFWGPANADSRLRVKNTSSDGDEAVFVDDGTQGSRRSAIHFRLGMDSSITWHSATNVDPLFNVDQDCATSAVAVVVHVSLQYRYSISNVCPLPFQPFNESADQVDGCDTDDSGYHTGSAGH
jgi:hypothetical protein